MRQAADILSSAPAMQIRHLETMQMMAKTSNAKVIFMPGPSQAMPGTPAFNAAMNGAEPLDPNAKPDTTFGDFAGQDHGFQQAISARVIENI